MGLNEPLISSTKNKSFNQQQINEAIHNSCHQSKQQAHLLLTQLSPTSPSSTTRRIKFILTLLIIIFTSFQVYSITGHKLQHSRNFIRFLNFYLIEHDYFDIYWAGQYMLNYPIQEYMLLEDVNEFLRRFSETMNGLDDSVYGQMQEEEFLTRTNKIFLQPKKGGIIEHDYVIARGFKHPFQVDNLTSIKNAILSSQEIQISLQPFTINSHLWHVMVSITTFSQTSVFVQIYAHEQLSLLKQHITTFIMGLLLFAVLVKQYMGQEVRWIDNIPYYFVCVLLVNTFFASLDGSMNVKWVVILDGVQCCSAWLLILKFLQKQDDYHISFLIRKSYVLVGRLFVSFGPIFIAFTVFGYTLFCRQAWQFGTFKRTFLTLFYISYYNATYESFIVTMRANPISMIFFFSFVILFTICVYSGMLVSVFCSYVWNKRQSKIKQDIVNNLKIQCSECNYKYKYVECLKLMKDPRRSLKMSFVMQVDFNNVDERHKYKKMLLGKMQFLCEKIEDIIKQTKKEIIKSQSQCVRKNEKDRFFEQIRKRLKKMLNEQMPQVEENNLYFSKSQDKNYSKEKTS